MSVSGLTDKTLGFELETLATKSPASSDAFGSIAVLPFSNMSPDPDQEYFCEGIAEEIINALVQIEGLRVTSRTSAFQFKGEAKDMREIGDALNVRTVREGSVRSSGRRLRVTAQLINVEDGYHLWSDRYDREMDDVFAIQDEIATHIVDALTPKLLGKKQAPRKKRHTDDLEAYQLYLKGQHNWYKRYQGSLQKAAHFFEKATERDPEYALAHAGVADAYASLGIYGLEPGLAGEKARAAAERALAIDDGLAESHASQAGVRYFYDWEWEESERGFRRAIELNPSYVRAYCWYQFLLCSIGRPDEAVSVMRRAQEQDPLSPYVNALAGSAVLASGNVAAALVEYEKALDVDEDFLLAVYYSGIAHSWRGDHGRAVAAFEKAAFLTGRAPYYLGLARLGLRAGRSSFAVGGRPRGAFRPSTERIRLTAIP